MSKIEADSSKLAELWYEATMYESTAIFSKDPEAYENNLIAQRTKFLLRTLFPQVNFEKLVEDEYNKATNEGL